MPLAVDPVCGGFSNFMALAAHRFPLTVTLISIQFAMSSPGDLPFAATLRVRDTCLCLHVRKAARGLSRRFDAAFQPLGVTSGQFSLLMALNRKEPPSLGSVAALLAMDRTTLTANLKPLERRGLLEIGVDARDKRSRRLVLTPLGRELLLAALPLWESVQAAVEGLLPPSRAGDLRADLLALSSAGAAG